MAAALAECEGMKDVCPVWFVCMKLGVLPPVLHNACGNSSHTPGSEAHPDWNMRELQYWTHDIRMPDYRVWWDCSDGSCTWTAPGVGWKRQHKGKGKGKDKGKTGKGGKGY